MSSCTVLACPTQFSRLSVEAKLFQGLADPTRLAVLKALVGGPCRVVDLCTITGRAQPNVSAHLACLKDCGLVVGEVRGRETLYRLAEPEMVSILQASERITNRLGQLICQCPLLPSMNPNPG
ncbi:MAG: winged helix-turn-helix transcriptional regulator [Armatimonadetes bacterium]|nr:winged helix-turn-helix transcriptional regulator [Armatimonadota bacterium]